MLVLYDEGMLSACYFTHQLSACDMHCCWQGNGHEHDFMDDENVYIMDVYNFDIYPHDRRAKRTCFCYYLLICFGLNITHLFIYFNLGIVAHSRDYYTVIA